MLDVESSAADVDKLLRDNHIVVRGTPVTATPRGQQVAVQVNRPAVRNEGVAAMPEVLFRSNQSSRGSRTLLDATANVKRGPCLGEAYKKKKKRKQS